MERSAQSDASQGESEDIDFRQILTLLLERRWLIIACVVLVVGAAVAYLYLTPPIFRATALIEVPQQSRNSARIEYADSEDFRGDEALGTIVRSLQRLSLFQKVIDRDDVRAHPGLQVDRDQSERSTKDLDPAEQLEECSSIQVEKGTRLIAISVEHSDPAFARLLANAIVEEFIRERTEARSGSSESGFEFLVHEAERFGKKLQESQAQLQGFEEAIASREKVEEQRDALDILTQRYGEAHPTVLQGRSLLTALTENYQKALDRVRPFWYSQPRDGEPTVALDPMAEFELLKSRHKIVSGEVDTSQALFEGILSRMKEADVTKQMNTVTIEVAEDARLPTKPVKPVKSIVLAASVVLGGGLGIFLVFGLHVMNHTLRTVAEAERFLDSPVIGAIPQDDRLPSSKWLDRKSGRRLKELIAEHEKVGSSGKPRRRKGGTIEPLVGLSDSGGAIAESFRSLRTELALCFGKEASHSYLVTSSIPNEGKSFVAANLAFAFAAQKELKTLLIDADLRLPTIGRIFNLEESEKGLGKVLATGALGGKWKTSVIDSGIANLDLMLAGRMVPNPAELLSGEGLKRLLGEISEFYQCVVIDSAPVNTVADSLLVARHVGSAILVVRARSTSREVAVRARDLLAHAGSPPIGLVLNRLPKRPGLASDPYHYYYNAAAQGYGDNYGS